MIDRRHFIATGLAMTGLSALAAPAIAQSASSVIKPRYQPTKVQIKAPYGPGQLLILPRAHFLYYITAPGEAMRYGVGVGRAGLEFQGTATIQAKRKWPDWRPTDEMIEREPRTYAKFAADESYRQPGGPGNPLGARALYLFKNGRDTYFRIHGTNAPRTIGLSVSNGCIRMLNAHVEDLYERVPIGTKVTVL
ncbi:L,D-transpeptidase [Roseovarius sp.]|uniref:L,D-transpeptidase n=1 Tax=Roseovarius sp. TaxID=1486281 RepID=UPI003BA9AA31